MNKYEAMFIVKPDLSDEDKKALFTQMHDAVTKNGGAIASGAVWSEKRKLYFPLRRYMDGIFYLLNFSLPPVGIKDLRQAYRLNENILRVQILNND